MTREEAINEIKSWAIPSKKGREVLEILIPELRESENERIRKFLIDLVSTMNWRVDWPEEKVKEEKVKCIAWLEKQKEEEGYEAIPVESTLEYKLGFKAGKESEKQKEQEEQNEKPSKPELKIPEWVCGGWDDEYMINTVIGRYSLHAEVAKKRGDTHDYNLSKSMENWLRNVVKPLILEKQKEEKHATIEQVYEKFLSSDTLKSAKENKYIRAQVLWELMHNGIITEVDYQYLTDDKRKPWTAEEYRIAYQKGFEMSEQLKQKEQSLRDFIDDFPYSDEQKEQKPTAIENLAEHIKAEFEGFRNLLKKKGIDYQPTQVYWDDFAKLFVSSARKYGLQKPVEKPSKEDCVKKFKALCDAYEIKLPNREYDIYHLCKDLHKLFGDIQKPVEYGDDIVEDAEEYTSKVDCGEYGVEITEAYIAGALRERSKKPVEWKDEYREEDIQTRFAFYTYKDDPSTLYLSNVFVEEASRNHGFGTRILKAAEKAAEAVGATTISLKVKQDSPANAWYRKNGYGYVAFEGEYDWLEKTLEYMKPNKPMEWSEEDERMLKKVMSICELSNDKEAIWNWLCSKVRDKSIRPKPKQEWSEEDEKIFNNIIEKAKGGHWIEVNEITWLINRFKSLRPQPKQEWSEEDENTINELCNIIVSNSKNGYLGRYYTGDLVQKLKSVRPSWKPSEHQMNILKAVKEYVGRGSGYWGEGLGSLIEDLEKLM